MNVAEVWWTAASLSAVCVFTWRLYFELLRLELKFFVCSRHTGGHFECGVTIFEKPVIEDGVEEPTLAEALAQQADKQSGLSQPTRWIRQLFWSLTLPKHPVLTTPPA